MNVVQGIFDVEASSDGVQTLGCVSDNDTVTHIDADVKHSVDVVWNAMHNCSSSDVYFR